MISKETDIKLLDQVPSEASADHRPYLIHGSWLDGQTVCVHTRVVAGLHTREEHLTLEIKAVGRLFKEDFFPSLFNDHQRSTKQRTFTIRCLAIRRGQGTPCIIVQAVIQDHHQGSLNKKLFRIRIYHHFFLNLGCYPTQAG